MRTPPWGFQPWRLAAGAALTLGLTAGAVAGPGAAASATIAAKPPCCRVLMRSAAVAWGNNYVGELGNGVSGQVASPNWTAVTRLTSGVVQVSGGTEESLALTSDGQVWAWGGTSLGTGASGLSAVPVLVPGLSGITQVAAGQGMSLALRSDGTVWAWGDNESGDLGIGSTAPSYTPVQVSGLTGVTRIVSAGGWSLALRSDGTVWSWGYNASGQLGNGTTFDSDVPVRVTGLSHVTQIAAGGQDSMAVATNGITTQSTVYAWGGNSYGQLGDGTFRERPVPVPIAGISTPSVLGIAVGGDFALVLGTDGTLWGWGENNYGQLGNGSTLIGNVTTPREVRGLESGIVQIAAGNLYAMERQSDGSVWAWGQNGAGELGNGTTSGIQGANPSPVQVTGLRSVSQISAGQSFGLAIHSVPFFSLPSSSRPGGPPGNR
jgi:alpha-tubulin suppressor-like RCC1 family protein